LCFRIRCMKCGYKSLSLSHYHNLHVYSFQFWIWIVYFVRKSTYSFYEVDVSKQCSYKISINPHLTTHLIWSRIKSIKFPSIFDLEDTPHYTLNRIPRFEMDRFLEKCTSDIVFVKFSSVTCSCHLGWFAGIYILYQIYLNRGYT
jgi:hypothetical protein